MRVSLRESFDRVLVDILGKGHVFLDAWHPPNHLLYRKRPTHRIRRKEDFMNLSTSKKEKDWTKHELASNSPFFP
uniref:Uncharacterized protein n=1 Tax=Utricularia reniformis TaxID=192314 RepID=A0A1Y0AYS2_9LAMI|nr:hypothetical protein AEK19_MT0654 [Utricularia reniformis]ART30298.1 hypothetical protein AEK19_MT0654 [Utricularia reniformis]